ncbi:MAG: hypothetical protein AAFU41_09315 [Pseudomonadota bacterium]
MHPPFFVVDHKIGPDIHHHSDHKPTVRRGLAARLRLLPATTGWPPVSATPATAEDPASVTLPSGRTVPVRPVLQITPMPRSSVKDALGRWMIRTGQRLILENRA